MWIKMCARTCWIARHLLLPPFALLLVLPLPPAIDSANSSGSVGGTLAVASFALPEAVQPDTQKITTLSTREFLRNDSLLNHKNGDLESKTSGLETGNDGRPTSHLDGLGNTLLKIADEKKSSLMGRQLSSMSFPSLESALLSLAFLTFAVFLIDLVRDLFTTTSTGRKRREENLREHSDTIADLIVIILASLDTASYGRHHPDCGHRLICHLNRTGWHKGPLGTAANLGLSLVLSLFSPDSELEENLASAEFGRLNEECALKFSGCPSVVGSLL